MGKKPKKTKENKIVTLTQFCLPDANPFDFIDTFDKQFVIHLLRWRAVHKAKKMRADVPDMLKKTGVKSVRTWHETDSEGTFKGLSRQKMKETLTDIATRYSIPQENFILNRLTVGNGHCELTFKRVRKELKDASDKRKKVRVLGLVRSSDPKHTQTFLYELGAKKFACRMMKTEGTLVLCTEVV